VMALSGHKTPQAARLYVKRTERQRIAAATKRRQWVEANETETRVENGGGCWESKWNKRVDETRMKSMALPTGVEPVFSD